MVKFLGVIGFVLMAVEYAKPIQWIKVYYKIDQGSNTKQLGRQILRDMVNCCLCLGFWVGLAFYQDFYFAVLVSFASELTYRIWNKVTLLL